MTIKDITVKELMPEDVLVHSSGEVMYEIVSSEQIASGEVFADIRYTWGGVDSKFWKSGDVKVVVDRLEEVE